MMAISMDPPDAKGRGEIIEALLNKTLAENGYDRNHKADDSDSELNGNNPENHKFENNDTQELGGLTEEYMPGDLVLLVNRACMIASLERVQS